VKLLTDNLTNLEKICKGINPKGWEDLRQDVIVKVLESGKEFESKSKFLGWCKTVAITTNIDNHKKKAKECLRNDLNGIYDDEPNVFDKVKDIKGKLTGMEKMWIDVYLDNDCRYINIQREVRISRQLASERIKEIIEKCKRLK
jgi:DNA-directed RNA polymerase specialized sigma24 family protein